jgi:putative spermidine/putrescine transport system ATP-binding protein
MPLAVMLAGLSGPARLALRPETLIPVAPETPGAIVGRLKTVEYTGAERLAHVALGRDGRGPVIVARTAAPLPAPGTVLGLATGTVAGLFDDATGARLGPNQKE